MANFAAFQAKAIGCCACLMLSVIAILVAAGCSTKPDVMVERNVALGKYSYVEVAPAQNETGSPENEAAAGYFRDDLVGALQSEGVTISDSGPAGSTLRVKPALVHYAPGSAISRSILPGSGRTQATVALGRVDKTSGESIGDLGSSDQVATGGLLSAGADRWILKTLANGMAAEPGSRLKGQ
jgi:hypothetical protein